jgi:hypothetical protein
MQAFMRMTRIMLVLEVDFVKFEKERKERLAEKREEVMGVLEAQKEASIRKPTASSGVNNAFPSSVFNRQDDRKASEREQEELKKKIQELKDYEKKVDFIVGVMRVPDITFCAPR